MALGIAQCFTWASTTVLILLMPRYLGDVDLGRFVTATFFITFLSLVANLGMGTHLIKATATADAKDVGSLAINAIALRVPLIALSMLAGVVVVNLLLDSETSRLIFYASLPGFVLATIYGSISASLKGMQEMKPVAVAEGVSKVTQTIVIIAVLVGGYGVVAVAGATVVGPVLALLVAVPALGRRTRLRMKLDFALWRTLLVGGAPFLIWQIALLTYGQVDLVMLTKMTTEEVVGWYAAAYRLISIPVFLPVIVTGAILPALSSASRDPEAVGSMLRSALRTVFFLTLPLGIGTALLPDRLIALLGYPAEFDNSVPLISILALHMPVVSVTMILGTCLIAIDKQWRWVTVGILAACLNPVLNLVAIPVTSDLFDNGAIGAAVSTNVTELLMLGGALYLLPLHYLGQRFSGEIVRIVVAGLVMAPVVWFARGFDGIFLPVIAGAMTYFIAAFVLGAIPVRELRAIIAQRAARLSGA